MGNRKDQSEATRGRILNAALSEFIAHGYNGASTRSITTAANVSPGLLFHYFPSKDNLYLELVRFGFQEMRVDVEEAQHSPLAYLTGMAERIIGMLRDQHESAAMFVFMNDVASHPGFVSEADALMAEHDIVRQSIPVVTEGQRRGELRTGSPEALALAFWGALQGIAEDVAAHPERPLPDPEWIVDIVRKRSES